MEQNIGFSLTQGNFSLNHDVVSGECESTLESSGKYNPALQCTGDGEAISSELIDVSPNFAISQSREGTEIQQDPGLLCFDDLSAPGQIFEGDFGLGNGLVCFETNLMNTNQQPLQNQSGWTDSINNQECFSQIDETSKPTNLFRLTQNNEDKFCIIPRSEYRLHLEKE